MDARDNKIESSADGSLREDKGGKCARLSEHGSGGQRPIYGRALSVSTPHFRSLPEADAQSID